MTKQEVIRDSLVDMLGVEQYALQRIEPQTRDEGLKKFPNAHVMLQRVKTVLNSHIDELEQLLSSVNGGFEARVKKTATFIAGSVAGIFGKLRVSEPVSKNLRDDYTLLNHAVINYGMLHTAALALDETRIATMAEEHMAELTPLIVELSDLIPFVLATELADKGKIEDSTVALQAAVDARVGYRGAWSREVTMRT